MLRVLALEPYYGGSHRDFLDSWADSSAHHIEVLGLPANKWKWRMRHSALTFAKRIADEQLTADVIFCSDMVPLAELVGLLPLELRTVPSVLYFHENQLTYPVRVEKERDLHFALTNISAALAANRVWFNSFYHRSDFLAAIDRLFKRMPDHRPEHAAHEIEIKSRVMPVGIPQVPLRSVAHRDRRHPGPLRILWCARWEFDKGPETFFAAIHSALERDPELEIRLDVIGESFGRVPEVFARARASLEPWIGTWGFRESRADYEAVLLQADVVVSTAEHEFFGVAIVEAIAAGCFPLLPNRLVYPELLSDVSEPDRQRYYYDGSAETLSRRLVQLARRVGRGESLWWSNPEQTSNAVQKFARRRLIPVMDAAVEDLVAGGSAG